MGYQARTAEPEEPLTTTVGAVIDRPRAADSRPYDVLYRSVFHIIQEFPRPDLRPYLGQTVTIEIDRPVGYVHRKGEKTLVYPINYGYIPGVLGGDGEELDVFLLGVDQPVATYTGRIVGIVYRADDVEDKLIMAPDGMDLTVEEMTAAVYFQEKYYDSHVET